tara:strand:- start:245 stop:481 length:237 start_codon:yes stop_codon:yes gene_type:complete
MSTKTSKPLPKWFDGTVYDKGDTVSNPYTGEWADLSAEELSMYDLIKGAEFTNNYTILRKGLDWFRRANAEAYMTLLD